MHGAGLRISHHMGYIVFGQAVDYIHPMRAWHAVTALRTPDPGGRDDGLANLTHQLMQLRRESTGLGVGSDAAVFLNHVEGIHPGENAGHLRLIPKPAKSKLSVSVSFR